MLPFFTRDFLFVAAVDVGGSVAFGVVGAAGGGIVPNDFCGCFVVGEGIETCQLLEVAYFAASNGDGLVGSP